jgi:apolipoprotein N-acyltransferase
MAYDHYVVFCSPLFCNTVMPHRVCSIMMAVVYSLGFFGATVHTTHVCWCYPSVGRVLSAIIFVILCPCLVCLAPACTSMKCYFLLLEELIP